tara:strand:+ start:6513 stop:6776 length:264 start_codon:yes stop_codon:yes gene_type:complete
MAISKKKAILLNDLDIPQINLVISKLYDDLNDVINSVNQGNTTELKNFVSGKSGDIRLSKINDGSYEIQGRTDEGWVSMAMTFKDTE